jgi:hypothetical protein
MQLPQQELQAISQKLCNVCKPWVRKSIQPKLLCACSLSVDAKMAARVRSRLAAYYDEFGLGAVPEPNDPLPRFDEERLQLVLDVRPPVVSFHFGLPPADTMKHIKQTGAIVLSSATTVAEARKLEAEGADAIIAQGLEAGGHRGTFTPGDGAGLIGTMALVPQVVDAVGVPVIAAGGIADGRGIAAAFALGASGVQIGTAFLGCPETVVPEIHRDAPLSERPGLSRESPAHPKWVRTGLVEAETKQTGIICTNTLQKFLVGPKKIMPPRSPMIVNYACTPLFDKDQLTRTVSASGKHPFYRWRCWWYY